MHLIYAQMSAMFPMLENIVSDVSAHVLKNRTLPSQWELQKWWFNKFASPSLNLSMLVRPHALPDLALPSYSVFKCLVEAFKGYKLLLIAWLIF